MTPNDPTDWTPDQTACSVDLNEDALIKAIQNIEAMTAPQATQLLVTAEGIAYVQTRYETDPEFKALIKERAEQDADYKTLLTLMGILKE